MVGGTHPPVHPSPPSYLLIHQVCFSLKQGPVIVPHFCVINGCLDVPLQGCHLIPVEPIGRAGQGSCRAGEGMVDVLNIFQGLFQFAGPTVKIPKGGRDGVGGPLASDASKDGVGCDDDIYI